MARSYHNNKNINIKNSALQKVWLDKQQLLENDTNNHEMSSTPKSIKEQEHKSSFKKKLLKKYIFSQLKNPDLIRLYINFQKHLFS